MKLIKGYSFLIVLGICDITKLVSVKLNSQLQTTVIVCSCFLMIREIVLPIPMKLIINLLTHN
jgi:hypothetical protein